jgi:hypothetical protein
MQWAFSAISKLFPGRENTIFDLRATDDKFVIVLGTDGLDKSEADRSAELMKKQGAVEIIDKEYENVKE